MIFSSLNNQVIYILINPTHLQTESGCCWYTSTLLVDNPGTELVTSRAKRPRTDSHFVQQVAGGQKAQAGKQITRAADQAESAG